MAVFDLSGTGAAAHSARAGRGAQEVSGSRTSVVPVMVGKVYALGFGLVTIQPSAVAMAAAPAPHRHQATPWVVVHHLLPATWQSQARARQLRWVTRNARKMRHRSLGRLRRRSGSTEHLARRELCGDVVVLTHRPLCDYHVITM